MWRRESGSWGRAKQHDTTGPGDFPPAMESTIRRLNRARREYHQSRQQ